MSRLAPVRARAQHVPTRRSSQITTNSTGQPCQFGGELGCKNTRKKDSIFCGPHDRIVDAWSSRSSGDCDRRKQDLRRWAAFHEYTHTKRKGGH